MKVFWFFILSVTAVIIGFILALGNGWFGEDTGPGTIEGPKVAIAIISERTSNQKEAAKKLDAATVKQILFGDLHVHTTLSVDAFNLALPMFGGNGARPPADACDYARYCSSLDFWSINDHAESFDKQDWTDTKEAIRQCNAVSGDPTNPDLVSYLGWEWSQMGSRPDNHYGHKNVIFLDTEDDLVPTRAIGAVSAPESIAGSLAGVDPFRGNLVLSLLAPEGGRQIYHNYAKLRHDMDERKNCKAGKDVRKLSKNCYESVATPRELFEKLDQWGFPTMVIPHGNTWGYYTPGGATLDKQLTADQNASEVQFLFEIFSGHGNAEEYRDWRAIKFDDDGNPYCPSPSDDYEPSCWRAGEIIRDRCLNDGNAEGTCHARAVEAQTNYVQTVGISGFLTVPGADVQDWADAGQCKDCFLPTFNHRPANSAQYALALTNFDDPDNPKRFNFGFMGSSDNHTARPGTGYKEIDRQIIVEGGGPPSRDTQIPGQPEDPAPVAFSNPVDISEHSFFDLAESDRVSSFFMSGGLIAAHSEGRDRNSIWDSMERKEVYATSGDRILLWFDMVNVGEFGADMKVAPMGAEVPMGRAPKFRVRAIGAYKQRPGCPDITLAALTPERLDHLCRGECYNPTDERKYIEAIEVIRVLPQSIKDEPIKDLIQDPWKRFECDRDRDGCVVEFEDPEFRTLARDATYYVRAIQKPSLAVNGGHLRCDYDSNGNCIRVNPCFKDYRTDKSDDCLERVSERAWSSPIFVTYDAEQAAIEEAAEQAALGAALAAEEEALRSSGGLGEGEEVTEPESDEGVEEGEPTPEADTGGE